LYFTFAEAATTMKSTNAESMLKPRQRGKFNIHKVKLVFHW